MPARSSRRWVRFYLVVAVLLGLLGYWTWTQVVDLTPPSWAPAGAQPYEVVRVVDGDTIVARHRVGGQERRIRYLNIDAPELGGTEGAQVFAREALEANRQWVEGKTVWIVPGRQELDDHGRMLGYVYADGRFVNLDLVKEGYAQVMLVAPNLDHAQDFVEAQRQAHRQGKGLWSTVETVEAIQDPAGLRRYAGKLVRLQGRVGELVPGSDTRPLIVRLAIQEPDEGGRHAASLGDPAVDPPATVWVTLLLFPELRPFFPRDLEAELKDRRVEVVGLLEFQGGRAQMVVREPGQLQVVPDLAEVGTPLL